MPDAASSPHVSLIVCTIGRTDKLERLFQSLFAQTCHDFEVILVDQNPEGYLDAIVTSASQKLTLHHVRSLPGLSRARNVGMARACGAILAFPDDDCWYPADTIERLIALFVEHKESGILTCPTRDAQGMPSNGKFLTSTRPVTRFNIWRAGNSNGVFVRKEAATLIGGFNEQLGVGAGTPFGAGEETDFLLRALQNGIAILFLSDLYVHHDQVNVAYDAATFGRVASYARGFGRTLRLNALPFPFVCWMIGKSLCAVLLGLVRLKPDYARYKWTWVYWAASGYFAPVHAKE